MTPRSIRRAAERKALKEARRSSRLTANQANAQLSTGPRTPEGKAKSSVNAVKTALTGRTVLLPTDDVAAYEHHIQIYVDEFQPVGPRESELVQALADHSWRLKRIASLEMAIYAFGHEQFAEQFADRGDMQASFTQIHIFLHYEKQLRNLQLQESRIRRHREKDTAELSRCQHERLTAAANRTASVSESVIPPTEPRSIGFVFSSQPEWRAAEQVDAPWPDFPRLKPQSKAAASEPRV